MAKPKSDPCLIVIVGVTGDLTSRKLLPALYQLMHSQQLSPKCHILGVGRNLKLTDDRFRAQARAALADAGAGTKAKLHSWCDATVHYQGIGDGTAADYELLAARIAQLEREHKLPGNRVLYLALPPVAFPRTIEALGKSGLNRSAGWTRLVVEKPFGHDLVSARQLNALIHTYFDEKQVYRIDHYLGKEAVQNLLAFRFGNALFESAWNRDHVFCVEIAVSEELGIEDRAGYYEGAGALRDMVQNHLTQLLTLTAMEVPAAYDANSIRFEKVKVLRSIGPIQDDEVVFGQYAPGKNGQKALQGYRKEHGVAARSHTETFVALKLRIDNWRWQGVPFYLTTGKRLARRASEITIHFRRPPIALLRSVEGRAQHTNVLKMTLQPDEGFDLSFEVKSPGEHFTLQTQRMKFRYADAFGASLSGGYETLLLEIVKGDQTLFVHAEETEASWHLFAPLLRKRWPLHFYPAGSDGPTAAKHLRHPTRKG